jgi:hypothetical protein
VNLQNAIYGFGQVIEIPEATSGVSMAAGILIWFFME